MRWGSNQTAAEESNDRAQGLCAPGTAAFVSDGDIVGINELLSHAGELARQMTVAREALRRDWVARKFTAPDYPEAFYLRVTPHMAQWIVPLWADHKPFEDAQVSYFRSETPAQSAGADF